jgi:hypothetical protein
MNGFNFGAFLLWFFGSIVAMVVIISFIVRGAEQKKRTKYFSEQYNKAQQKLESARAKYAANHAHLKSIGFQTDQTKVMAGRTFYFDYQKRLTAYETYWFDEGHIGSSPPKPKLFENVIESAKVYGAMYGGASFCSDIRVFPDDKIIECALLQDGAVVKKSEGSAALAGVSIPYFGSLQGTAKSGGSEHETGSLAVRLTLDDLTTPSVIFDITSGADKSSKAYGVAFEQAQELFGIFDGITRMNLKAMQAEAESGKEAGEAQPAQAAKTAEQETDANTKDLNDKDKIFESIRQLGKLRDEGLLSEEEFAAQKKSLMERI